MESDMVNLMLQMRVLMEKNKHCKVIWERHEVMHRLYLDWRNSKEILYQYPAHYFMAGPLDVMKHYRFASTLEMDSDVEIDAWTKIIAKKFDKTRREDCMNYFLEELKYEPFVADTIPWHMSGNYNGSPMRRKHEQLELATMVFRCTDYLAHHIVDGARARDEGAGAYSSNARSWERTTPVDPAPLLWYPAFLTHPCSSIRRFVPGEGRPRPEACLKGGLDLRIPRLLWLEARAISERMEL